MCAALGSLQAQVILVQAQLDAGIPEHEVDLTDTPEAALAEAALRFASRLAAGVLAMIRA